MNHETDYTTRDTDHPPLGLVVLATVLGGGAGAVLGGPGGGGGYDALSHVVSQGQGGVSGGRVLRRRLDPAQPHRAGGEPRGEPVRAAPGALPGQQGRQGPRQEAGAQEGTGDELPRVDRVRQELRGQVPCGEFVQAGDVQ